MRCYLVSKLTEQEKYCYNANINKYTKWFRNQDYLFAFMDKVNYAINYRYSFFNDGVLNLII